MKKLLLLFAITALVSTGTFAQEQDAKEVKEVKDVKKERAEWEKKVKDELKLTAEQSEKYDALCKEYNEKIDAVLQDASLTKDVQKEKKMALKKEKETKLFEFLTPEQQTSYKELMDKKHKEMAEKKG